MVCRETQNIKYSPLYYCKESDRKHLCRNHLTHGNYGCQITTEIDQYPHPGNFQLTQFRQHIILRQILQTICWHESISI